ncbi:2870_t:CDS:10 [Funneliformis geosporum]|nr:2870_t:CDS:10 [Funneliformis geosporum]
MKNLLEITIQQLEKEINEIKKNHDKELAELTRDLMREEMNKDMRLSRLSPRNTFNLAFELSTIELTKNQTNELVQYFNSPTTNSPTTNSPTTNSPTTNSPTTNSPTTNPSLKKRSSGYFPYSSETNPSEVARARLSILERKNISLNREIARLEELLNNQLSPQLKFKTPSRKTRRASEGSSNRPLLMVRNNSFKSSSRPSEIFSSFGSSFNLEDLAEEDTILGAYAKKTQTLLAEKPEQILGTENNLSQKENKSEKHKNCRLKDRIIAELEREITDASFARWLRDIKRMTTERFLNEGDEERLRDEYQVYQQTVDFPALMKKKSGDYGVVEDLKAKIEELETELFQAGADLENLNEQIEKEAGVTFKLRKENIGMMQKIFKLEKKKPCEVWQHKDLERRLANTRKALEIDKLKAKLGEENSTNSSDNESDNEEVNINPKIIDNRKTLGFSRLINKLNQLPSPGMTNYPSYKLGQYNAHRNDPINQQMEENLVSEVPNPLLTLAEERRMITQKDYESLTQHKTKALADLTQVGQQLKTVQEELTAMTAERNNRPNITHEDYEKEQKEHQKTIKKVGELENGVNRLKDNVEDLLTQLANRPNITHED